MNIRNVSSSFQLHIFRVFCSFIVSPIVTETYNFFGSLVIIENDKILHDNKAIANIFRKYFTDATHSLRLKKKNFGIEKTLSKIKENFRIFACMKRIKGSQQVTKNSSFSVKLVSEGEIRNAIKALHINKPTISGNIPTNSLK